MTYFLSGKKCICFLLRVFSKEYFLASSRKGIDLYRYESEFFQNVVNGRDIVSWAAVDCSRPNGQSDELIGFVTARIVLAKDSEVCYLCV